MKIGTTDTYFLIRKIASPFTFIGSSFSLRINSLGYSQTTLFILQLKLEIEKNAPQDVLLN